MMGTEGRPCEDKGRRQLSISQWRRPQKKQPWSWTFNFQNCEKIKFCCLSYPDCGTLLWKLWQTNTLVFFVVLFFFQSRDKELLTLVIPTTGCIAHRRYPIKNLDFFWYMHLFNNIIDCLCARYCHRVSGYKTKFLMDLTIYLKWRKDKE